MLAHRRRTFWVTLADTLATPAPAYADLMPKVSETQFIVAATIPPLLIGGLAFLGLRKMARQLRDGEPDADTELTDGSPTPMDPGGRP